MNHPDYKHRTFAANPENSEDFNIGNLVDSVGLSVGQGEAIVLQMQSQYESNGAKFSDAINTYTLEAIRKELLDIQTVVTWYYENNKGIKNHE